MLSIDQVASLICMAVEAAERETVERCAKIADTHAVTEDNEGLLARDIAAQIRSGE